MKRFILLFVLVFALPLHAQLRMDALRKNYTYPEITVSGTSTLSGNVAVGGTLGVAGATTFSSTLSMGSAITLATGVANGLKYGADGSCKIYEYSDNTLRVQPGASDVWEIDATQLGSISTKRPALVNTEGSLTVPTLLPKSGDGNTGIGAGDADTTTVIAGGTNPVTAYTNGVVFGYANTFFTDSSSVDDDYGFVTNAIKAYTTGLTIRVSFSVANTGACTMQINGLGAKSIKKLHDQDPGDNHFEVGSIHTLIYDGTNFQDQTPADN